MKSQINNELISANAEETKYVVLRDGYRVSDKEYLFFDDVDALAEKSFWTRASNREKVEIVKYNPLKHKVW